MRDRKSARAGGGARVARAALWTLFAALAWPFAAGAQNARDAATPPGDAVMAHIEAVLGEPGVARAITTWGLSVADVRHDVGALSPLDRVRLAFVLTRRWRENESHNQAALQAQFLVTMSLMRESTLFASILSSSPSRLR